MIEAYEFVMIPLITALIKAFNMMGFPKKYNPAAAMILGVLGGIFYLFPDAIKDGILYGLVFGLSSIGLYSGAKTVKKGIEHNG